MPFEPINPAQFPKPIAPYSAGTRAGNTIYVSGTLALGEGGSVLHPDDAAAQRGRATPMPVCGSGGFCAAGPTAFESAISSMSSSARSTVRASSACMAIAA